MLWIRAFISTWEARAFAALIAAKSRRALVLAKEALHGLEPRDVLRTC